LGEKTVPRLTKEWDKKARKNNSAIMHNQKMIAEQSYEAFMLKKKLKMSREK
jgi:hypothetical protein